MYGIKFIFSEKNIIFPKCPEKSKKAKIFFTLFLLARAWRKMFSWTDHMLQGTGPIFWGPVPWSATQMLNKTNAHLRLEMEQV